VEEAFFYDWNSLVGEVGGSLGLFLGISLLAAFDAVAIAISYCLQACGGSRKFLKDNDGKDIVPDESSLGYAH